MWSDNEAEKDLLRFRYLADAAVNIVCSPHLLPTTIGIFGDWGSGKSTLLKMIDQSLAKKEGVLSIHFNGWLFEGYDDAKSALMGTILDTIQERNKKDESLWSKTVDQINKLRKRINWLHLASVGSRISLFTALAEGKGTLVGIGTVVAERIAKAMSEQEKDKRLNVDEIQKIINETPVEHDELRKNIREFRTDFQKLLNVSDIKTLVVFIDDLDRCLPSTIIETLEAIRLFLFVPGTVFLLGADERLVEYAVRQRFPELPGTRAEVGRDYLEKLVQIPIRIPPLSGAELHAYMNLLFAQKALPKDNFDSVCGHVAEFKHTNVDDLTFSVEAARELCGTYDKLPDLEGDLDFVAQITGILAPGMQGNPRRTKRFLNMLLLRLSLGEARGLRLERPILAKLMLLEYMKPEFFKQLANLQASQRGLPEELTMLEEVIRPAPMATAEEDKATAVKSGAKSSPDQDRQPAKPPTPTAPLPADVQPWIADEWIHTWLSLDPSLTGVDLRPYFYVAHDRLGALDIGQTRLSRAAAEVLNRLIDNQPVTREIGIKAAPTLNAAEATAVFDSLAQRVRQASSLEGTPLQGILFAFITARPELKPQLITLYGSLAVTKITLQTPSLIYEVTNGTPSAQAARALIEQWAKSSHAILAATALQALSRQWKFNS